MRWMHLALAPAMAGWQEHCNQKKRLQRAAFKIVLRWQHMALSPAFVRWQLYRQERYRFRRTAEKIVLRYSTVTVFLLFVLIVTSD